MSAGTHVLFCSHASCLPFGHGSRALYACQPDTAEAHLWNAGGAKRAQLARGPARGRHRIIIRAMMITRGGMLFASRVLFAERPDAKRAQG